MNPNDNSNSNKQEVDFQLDRLELRINEVKTLYEQYFTGTQPQPPSELNQEIKLQIRSILNTPFKSTSARFRLQSLIQRHNTFLMYFERTNQKRETGVYSRDVFKAALREYDQKATQQANLQPKSVSENAFKDLYQSYVNAHKSTNSQALDYETFSNKLKQQAEQLKKVNGLNKVNFKVVLQGNKVVVKASGS